MMSLKGMILLSTFWIFCFKGSKPTLSFLYQNFPQKLNNVSEREHSHHTCKIVNEELAKASGFVFWFSTAALVLG